MKTTPGEIKGQGFILRVTQAQEADVIVKLLTSEGEKISAFAKAGLKSKKRFGGALQPLFHVRFRAIKKLGHDLYYLEEAQVRHDFGGLRTNMERLVGATYAAELTEHSAQEGLAHEDIYNLFGAVMKALESGLNIEGVLRQFEVKLLSVLGWLPSVNKCSNCGAADRDLTLDPNQGAVVCRDCGKFPVLLPRDVQSMFRYLLQTSITKSELRTEDVKGVEKVTSSLLKAHWGQHAIKSLKFLESMQSQR
jgi:DNA repair protein RecO (recombination protein O)